jgi:hypothetical protein
VRILRLLALPAVVAGLVAFGWTYDVPQAPPGSLSTTELGWIGGLRDWLATPLPARCGTAIAEAPTGRLGRIRDLLRDACEEAAPARRLERTREARRRLAAELRDRRTLPVSGELVGASRIEPRLGEAMTQLAAGRRVEVRCWSQADWHAVLAEEAALTGAPPARVFLWLPAERSLQLQGVHCGPLVRLALGERPRARGRRADLAVALWVAATAAESFSRRPCVPPAVLATALGSPGRFAVELVSAARAELGPLLTAPSRRCRTSRPS